MDRHLLAAGLVAFLLAGGCTHRDAPKAAVPATAAPAKPYGSYVDLRPGWRVSVITPLLKSGGYRLDPKALQPVELTAGPGNSLNATMAAGDDFNGYERSYYGVTPNGPGVRVRFASAEVIREGKTVATSKAPVEPLFALRRGARHVRLVYLLRSSRADHNMAIVAASRLEDVQAITRDINDDPAQGCQPRVPGKAAATCQWVPAGIAVRPEMQKPGSTDWIPAR